jgi:hypothetical protein
MHPDQSQANERQVNAATIGDITSPPLGTVFAFEFKE